MTTTVTVKANHGWPVRVTPAAIDDSYVGEPQIVPAGEERDFYVHSGQDLVIHEIQPGEPDFKRAGEL